MVELAAASLENTGALRLRVSGSSMLPAVRPGDVLSIRRCAATEARAGDLVLFRRGDRLFVHRVLRAAAGAVETRGDAMDVPDPPVAAPDLLGKVVAIERRGRAFAPRAGTRMLERAAARLFRRSALAGRLFTRWNARAGRAA